MPKHHRAQHHIFRQLHGFRFDHQNSRFSACNNQIQLGGFQFGQSRVQNVFAIDISNTRSTDRAVKRDAGNRQGGGSTDQGRNIRIDFTLGGHDGSNDLHVIVKTLREKRAQRAIDQTGSQDFLLGGTTFTLEETTGNTTRSVSPFLVINRQREEVLAGLDAFGANHCHQHYRVIQANHYGARRLAGNLPSFQGQCVTPERNTFFDMAQNVILYLIVIFFIESAGSHTISALAFAESILAESSHPMGHEKTEITYASRGAQSRYGSGQHCCRASNPAACGAC